MGLINVDNKYTNLALLISNQCPYSIKVARYKDNTKSEFLDSKEFSEESIFVILPKLNLKNEYVLIIDYLKQNTQGTRENFENVLNLGKSATINILNELL